jgi:hypothetical protein
MTNRRHAGTLVLMLALGLSGCSPTAPSRSPRESRAVAPHANPQPPAPEVPAVTEFRGTVHDNNARPLAGVLIGSWSGPEAYAISDAAGEFSLRGRFTGSDVFHAGKEGYIGQVRSLDSGLAFVLPPRP